MSIGAACLALGLGAGASSRSIASCSRPRRHLVARPGVGKRPRRVQRRDLELDHPRVRAERRLDAVPGALVATHGRAGAAAGASAEARPRPLVVRRRPARERHRSGAARRARASGHASPSPSGRTARNERDARRHGLRASPLRPRAGVDPRRLGAADGGGAALGRRLDHDRRRGWLRAVHDRLARSEAARPARRERGDGTRSPARGHGSAGALGAQSARPARGSDPPAVHGLAHAAPRGVRRDAGIRDGRAAPGGWPRPRADEHRDDRAAVAGEHRARAGSRRAPAAQLRRRVSRSASRTASCSRRSRSPAASRSG